MICEKCGNKIDDDATYCSYCGMKIERKIVQQNNIEDISGISKTTGFLIILIGIIGIVDTVSFRIIWNDQPIYTSWYQFIYLFLYILGVVYGYKLTKRESWEINFTLILIYIIHYLVIFIEKNVNRPVIPLYIISGLSIIVLILLVIKKSEYNIEQKG
jgi:hypothetical protein